MVLATPDPDGIRTEIRCVGCDAHVGHVQCGEGFLNPAPNERHCVDSTSVCFVPRNGSSGHGKEVLACTYRGPVYMSAVRHQGATKTTFERLEGGEAPPTSEAIAPGSRGIWIALDTHLRAITMGGGATLGELHSRVCGEAGVPPERLMVLKKAGKEIDMRGSGLLLETFDVAVFDVAL